MPVAYLDLVGGLKSIKLVQQLQHGSLHFRVPATAATATVASGAANAVHLIHENDARSMLPVSNLSIITTVATCTLSKLNCCCEYYCCYNTCSV